MIEAIFVESLAQLEEVKWVKNQVFSNENDGVLNELTLISQQVEEQVLVYESNKPIGTGSMFCFNNRFEIVGIYVLKEQQRLGYGDLVVKMLMDKAFKMGAKEVWVLPNDRCGQLFQKIGFIVDIETNYLYIRQNMIKRCKR